MLLLKTFDGRKESLTDHCIELIARYNTEIRKQSLDSKFNPNAVCFVKQLSEEYLQHQFETANKIKIEGFKKVFVQDSTRFGLPDSFKESYPGYGGRGAQAGAQIQFAYELVSNRIHHIELHAATQNDRSCAINNEWIEKGALVLRDLGYYSMEGLAEIQKKQAYFVSRTFPRTALFIKKADKFERIDLESIIRKMTKNNIEILEQEVFIGLEYHMPVRAVITLVPTQVKEQRIREAKCNAKTRNGNLSKEYKTWAGINVYITNTRKEQLSKAQIPKVYRTRWQIELVFKTWKSYYNLNQYKSIKTERFLCYLYASLIQVVLHWQIFNCLQEFVWKTKKKLISLIKFSKIMSHFKDKFSKVLNKKKDALIDLLETLVLYSKEYLYKEKKKGKLGFGDLL